MVLELLLHIVILQLLYVARLCKRPVQGSHGPRYVQRIVWSAFKSGLTVGYSAVTVSTWMDTKLPIPTVDLGASGITLTNKL